MVLKCPQRNYKPCKLSIWPINKVLLLLLVEFNTHWLCVEKSWFFSVWYSLLKDIQTTVLFSFCEFNASSQFKQRKDLCDFSGEFKYKSHISNRCFILQFQRSERSCYWHQRQKGTIYVAAFTAPLANLKSKNEGKKFRPICCAPMLSLNARKIIAVKYTT